MDEVMMTFIFSIVALVISGLGGIAFVFFMLSQKLQNKNTSDALASIKELLEKDIDKLNNNDIQHEDSIKEIFKDIKDIKTHHENRWERHGSESIAFKKEIEDKLDKAIEHKEKNAIQADQNIMNIISELKEEIKELRKILIQYNVGGNN